MERFFRQTSPLVIWAIWTVSLYLYATQWSEIAVISGFTLHITDLLFGMTVVYCVAGAALTRSFHSPLESLLLLLCGLLVLNFTRGVIEASYNAAGVQFRNYSGFVSIIGFVYFWGRAFNLEWIFKNIIMLGWAIVLLGLARLALGDLNAFVREPIDVYYESRMFNKTTAIMLGEALLIALNGTLSLRGETKQQWWKGASFLMFAGILLISQQRTAIFATLAGIGVIITFAPRRHRMIMVAGGGVALLVGSVFFWTAWISSGGDLAAYVPRAISMIAEDDSTFTWRVVQWEDYVEVYTRESLFDQIIGQPMGALRITADENSIVFLVAHNGYLMLLLSAGVVGLLMFVLVLVWATVRSFIFLQIANSTHLSSNLRLALAIVVSHMVFSITYMLPNEQGLLLALALQIIGRPLMSFTNILGFGPRNRVGRTGS